MPKRVTQTSTHLKLLFQSKRLFAPWLVPLAVSTMIAFSPTALSQNQERIDSLQLLLDTDLSSKERSTVLYGLASLWLAYDSALAISYLNQGSEWALRGNVKEGELNELHLWGRMHFMNSRFDSAQARFTRLIVRSVELGSRPWEGKGYSSRAKVMRALGNTSEALQDNLHAVDILAEIDDKLALADVYNDLSVTYRNEGNHRQSLHVSEKALAIYRELDDHFGMAQVAGNLGLYFMDKGDFARAMEYFLASTEAAEKIGSKAYIATNYVNIGNIQDHQKDYNSSRASYLKALPIFRETGYQDAEGITLNYLAAASTYAGDLMEAQDYGEAAVQIFEQNGNKSYLATSLSNLGNNYVKLRDYGQALAALERSLALLRQVNNILEQPSVLNTIGEALYLSGRPRSALTYLLESVALAKTHQLPRDLRDATLRLAQVENSLGNHTKAYEYQRLYSQLQDSLLNEEEIKKITRLQADFEFRKEKDSLAYLQQSEALIFQQQLDKKQSFLYATVAGSVLILMILGLLYRSYLIKQKSNQELRHKNEIIALKNDELTQKNSEISDLRIQEKQMADETLAMKQRELTTVTMLSYEKNTLLEQLGELIGSLSKKVDDRVIPDLVEIKKIIKANLSEESWSTFMLQFEKVHPSFFSQLKEKFPNLTHHDLRLCAHLKVGMDNKEIAQVSAISTESVKKSTNRLKKKLGLTAEEDLRTFLISF